jgi:hypothetical protein
MILSRIARHVHLLVVPFHFVMRRCQNGMLLTRYLGHGL